MNILLNAQKNEITEHKIYSNLAKKTKDEHNKKIFEKLALDELKHYNIIKKHTSQDVQARKFRVFWYTFLATILGVAFAIHLMEKGEKLSQELYSSQKAKDFEILLKDEQTHEKELIKILNDSKVEYAGSIVLGLNDALVELTGALAGLSLAVGNGKLIAIIGGITGFAASMSMAASSYLSSKEEGKKDALKGATYTGVAYLLTVAILILPFILISNVILAMIIMLCATILIVAGYTFYISTAKDIKFWPKFFEMAIISITVAAISFIVGWLIRTYIGVEA